MEIDESVEINFISKDKQPETEEQISNSEEDPETNCSNWRQHSRTFMATLIASLGSVGIGTIFGYPAPAIPDMNSRANPFHLSEMDVAVVVSITSLGGLFGGLIGGILLDKYGRKSTLIYAIPPFALGWLLIVASPNVHCMSVGRLLTGFSSGVFEAAVPMYIVEISAPSVRGFMGSCYELFVNIGTLYTFSFGIFLPWTWLADACLTVQVVMIVCVLFVPESPRWLFSAGRKEECLESLLWLRGNGEIAGNEMANLAKASIRVRSNVGWREFCNPSVYRPILVIFCLMFFQNMAGYTAISSYMVTILDAGGTKWDAYAATAVVGSSAVLANLISAIIVDRVGRRVMLLISATSMTISLVGASVYFTLLEFDFGINVGSYSMTPFFCVFAYTAAISLGYGPIPYYLAGELLPQRVRGKARGAIVASGWTFSFLTCFCFPIAVEALHYSGVFWVMAASALLSTVYAYFVVPETKGLSLEQIERKTYSMY